MSKITTFTKLVSIDLASLGCVLGGAGERVGELVGTDTTKQPPPSPFAPGAIGGSDTNPEQGKR